MGVTIMVWFATLVVSGLCITPGLAADEAIMPREVIPLFNGRDLKGLSTWLKES